MLVDPLLFAEVRVPQILFKSQIIAFLFYINDDGRWLPLLFQLLLFGDQLFFWLDGAGDWFSRGIIIPILLD